MRFQIDEFARIVDKLAKAVQHEGAYPRNQRTHDDKNNPAERSQRSRLKRRRIIAKIARNRRKIGTSADHQHADYNRADNAKPAENLCQHLNLPANVAEHNSSPLPSFVLRPA